MYTRKKINVYKKKDKCIQEKKINVYKKKR